METEVSSRKDQHNMNLLLFSFQASCACMPYGANSIHLKQLDVLYLFGTGLLASFCWCSKSFNNFALLDISTDYRSSVMAVACTIRHKKHSICLYVGVDLLATSFMLAHAV